MSEAGLRASITGLILAGGAGARMGGVDKGLLDHVGRPLIAAIVERFRPQVGRLIISANRNLDVYRSFGHEVITDENPTAHFGPLAGVLAGLQQCTTPLLAVVPCDAPQLPPDLVATLANSLNTSSAQVVHAVTAARSHPVFMLCRREVLESLERYLADGGRKVRDWQASVHAQAVVFPDEASFANLNTPQQLGRPANQRAADE